MERIKKMEKMINPSKEKKYSEAIYFGYITCRDQKMAHFIATKCLEQRQIACANIFSNIESLYHWKGKLEIEKEAVLILKTKASQISSLKKLISSIHEYECPCILFIKIEEGHKPFMDWILSSTN